MSFQKHALKTTELSGHNMKPNFNALRNYENGKGRGYRYCLTEQQ